MLEKILVTSDLSAASNSVLPHALTLGQAFNSKLYLLHVMDPAEMREPERLEAFPPLSQFLKTDRDAPDLPPLRGSIPVGKVYRYHRNPEAYILKYTREKAIDLVCIATTTNTRKLAWWSAGEMTEALIKRARCSVLCLRGRPTPVKDWSRPRFKNVLLLLDLNDNAAVPLLKTLPLVHTFNSMLHVFPLGSGGGPGPARSHPLAELTKLNGDQTNVLLFAHPRNRLANLTTFVRKTAIDLIIIPANLRARVSGWLLNDALVRLLSVTDSPVLILR